jgi:hypothetical protein
MCAAISRKRKAYQSETQVTAPGRPARLALQFGGSFKRRLLTMPDKETRTVPLGLRITPTLKAAIDKAAADDERSVASYIERVVFEHLRKKGYLK